MRVTMLSKALVVGAYQRKCELIASHRDIELTVLVPPSWKTGKHIDALERLHTRGYNLRVIPLRFSGNFHLHYYPTLAHELACAQPDIVHIDEEPYNLATYLALRSARSLLARTVIFSWQNLLRRYPPPFRWMERYVLTHVDTAIAGNAAARSVLQAKGYKGTVSVIPQFGVDTEQFRPADNPRKSTAFTVGYTGRLVPEKGIDVLLRALAGLPVSTQAIIVGAGREAEKLQALANELHLNNRVRFLPPVSSAQMPGIYAKMDALVLPSRTLPNWKEQFGRVLIEAMSSGVPVIGSRSGEIPVVIGDAGLVFNENDTASLRRHIERLASQPALCADLATRGRTRAIAHYSMEQIAAETVAVYRSLLSA